MKRCIHCQKLKSITEYHNHKQMKDGTVNICKVCALKARKLNYEKVKDTPEYIKMKRDFHLRKNYGIGLEEYNQIFEEQEGCCHITGQIRGLLCDNCNLLIGNSKEEISTLINAIEYLKKFK